jgi:hypothetical protein
MWKIMRLVFGRSWSAQYSYTARMTSNVKLRLKNVQIREVANEKVKYHHNLVR